MRSTAAPPGDWATSSRAVASCLAYSRRIEAAPTIPDTVEPMTPPRIIACPTPARISPRVRLGSYVSEACAPWKSSSRPSSTASLPPSRSIGLKKVLESSRTITPLFLEMNSPKGLPRSWASLSAALRIIAYCVWPAPFSKMDSTPPGTTFIKMPVIAVAVIAGTSALRLAESTASSSDIPRSRASFFHASNASP